MEAEKKTTSTYGRVIFVWFTAYDLLNLKRMEVTSIQWPCKERDTRDTHTHAWRVVWEGMRISEIDINFDRMEI